MHCHRSVLFLLDTLFYDTSPPPTEQELRDRRKEALKELRAFIPGKDL